jgi:hypothetical protein
MLSSGPRTIPRSPQSRAILLWPSPAVAIEVSSRRESLLCRVRAWAERSPSSTPSPAAISRRWRSLLPRSVPIHGPAAVLAWEEHVESRWTSCRRGPRARICAVCPRCGGTDDPAALTPRARPSRPSKRCPHEEVVIGRAGLARRAPALGHGHHVQVPEDVERVGTPSAERP